MLLLVAEFQEDRVGQPPEAVTCLHPLVADLVQCLEQTVVVNPAITSTSSFITNKRASLPCRRRDPSAPRRRALLAGVAEYLSERYGLPVPEWVKEPEYFLDDMWDPWEDICPAMEETRPYRTERTPLPS